MTRDSNGHYQRLQRLTATGDAAAAEALYNEALRRMDQEPLGRTLGRLESTLRFNTGLELFIALNSQNVRNLRSANLPEGLVPPECLDCLRKIETRFFDVKNGGFVEIEDNFHADTFLVDLLESRCLNQQLDEEMLNSQGPTWGKLRWPALLQKLLERREFDLGNGQKETGCLLQHAARMVWGADAVGYYDMRANKNGEITSAKDFEFLFVDGATEFEEDGERVSIREITIFYEKADGSIGKLRPDMSQAEMVIFMGRHQSNGGTWSRQDLIQEINRREGWQFSDYWGIRKSVKPPYKLPEPKAQHDGKIGGDIGAVELVCGSTHFIRGRDRNEEPKAMLEGDPSRNEYVYFVYFFPYLGKVRVAFNYAHVRSADRGAVRMLKG